MAYRHKMNSRVNYSRILSPWTHCTYHACTYNAAYMTSNFVVCQSRHIAFHVTEFTIHGKTSLNQSLESVTNTKNKTVALFKKIHNLSRNASFAKTVCNKFCRTIRFVSGTKSTAQSKNLSFLKFPFKISKAFFKHCRSSVCQNNYLSVRSCQIKRTCHIKFTVSSREYRQKNAWLSRRSRKHRILSSFAQRLVNILCKIRKRFLNFSTAYRREHFSKFSFPCAFNFGKTKLHFCNASNSKFNVATFSCNANLRNSSSSKAGKFKVSGSFNNNRTVQWSKQILSRSRSTSICSTSCTQRNIFNLYTDSVTHSHLGNSFSNTACANRVHSIDFSSRIQAVKSICILVECIKIRSKFSRIRNAYKINVTSSLFK